MSKNKIECLLQALAHGEHESETTTKTLCKDLVQELMLLLNTKKDYSGTFLMNMLKALYIVRMVGYKKGVSDEKHGAVDYEPL